MARMIGYVCQPFCGKHCCRTPGNHRNRQAEKQTIKRREERSWKREVRNG